MSYLVFARKFRPQRFEDLLGQEPVVVTLRRAIEQQRVGHAYLFAGPRGTGKTSTARIFAKALNCERGPTPEPCNRCPSCLEITEGRSLDVIEVDGASNRSIDDIRTLRENVKFAPVKGHFKIYIIDEFHQITAEAFNALLKTLEEPPTHVKFIFATTAPHKVPATILSRCQRYEFKRLPPAVILHKLEEIARQEQITVATDALATIARAAAGSMRDAESLLDQLAAFGQRHVQMADVQAVLGVVEDEVLSQAIDAVIQQQPAALLRLVTQLTDAGRDLTQFLTGLIGYVRNLMVAQLGEAGGEILGATPDALKRLMAQAGAFSEDELSYLFYLLVSTYDIMRRVGDARTPLEVTLIRASRREPIARISELIRQLDEQAPRVAARPADTPIPAVAVPETPQTQAVPAPAAPSLTLEMLQGQWTQLISAVQERRMSTAAYLLEARPVAVSAECLTIGFPKEFLFHQEALQQPEHRAVIEGMLRQVMGWTGRVTIEVVPGLVATPPAVPGEEPAEGVPPPPSPVIAEPPIVRSAAELFGGRVRAPTSLA